MGSAGRERGKPARGRGNDERPLGRAGEGRALPVGQHVALVRTGEKGFVFAPAIFL